jgi:polyisoprenoid-binding protein YceI
MPEKAKVRTRAMVAADIGVVRALGLDYWRISPSNPRMMNASVMWGCRVLLLSCALATAGQAAPQQVPVIPPGSRISFRAYGLGLMPIDASFARFDGWLRYDPASRTACRIELVADVGSVVTEDALLRSTLIGTDFMDADRYPELAFAGGCDANGVSGTLRLHGVTRPFSLSLTWTRDEVTAEGRLLRADWGMTAMPLLGGRTVRIRVAIPLKAAN